MSKTALTKAVESALFEATNKMGTYGCFEVSIGFGGSVKERVDYMTFDSNGVIRCYEIKVSKSDFHSKHHNTFCGHYNYYVMPAELAKEVMREIPVDVGVFSYTEEPSLGEGVGFCQNIKSAGRREVSRDDADKLKDYFIRSLSRDSENLNKSKSAKYMTLLKQENNGLRKDLETEKKSAQRERSILLEDIITLHDVLDWIDEMDIADAINWDEGIRSVDIVAAKDERAKLRRASGMLRSDEEAIHERILRKIGVPGRIGRWEQKDKKLQNEIERIAAQADSSEDRHASRTEKGMVENDQ